MENKKLPDFQYGIKNIRLVLFNINESVLKEGDPESHIHVQFSYKMQHNIEKELLVFTIVATHYKEDLTISKPIAITEVETHFYIENLKDLVEGAQVYLPDQLWISILGLSISHTRAIQASCIANTDIKTHLLPVVNPVDVAKAFFPNIKKNLEEQERKIEDFKSKMQKKIAKK